MDIDKFANLFFAVFLGLQLLGYIMLFCLWITYGGKGLIVGLLLYMAICFISFFFLNKIKVYNKENKLRTLQDILGDVISIVFLMALSAIFFTIIAVYIGYKLAHKHNLEKSLGFFIPIISIGIIYASLFIAIQVKTK